MKSSNRTNKSFKNKFGFYENGKGVYMKAFFQKSAIMNFQEHMRTDSEAKDVWNKGT